MNVFRVTRPNGSSHVGSYQWDGSLFRATSDSEHDLFPPSEEHGVDDWRLHDGEGTVVQIEDLNAASRALADDSEAGTKRLAQCLETQSVRVSTHGGYCGTVTAAKWMSTERREPPARWLAIVWDETADSADGVTGSRLRSSPPPAGLSLRHHAFGQGFGQHSYNGYVWGEP